MGNSVGVEVKPIGDLTESGYYFWRRGPGNRWQGGVVTIHGGQVRLDYSGLTGSARIDTPMAMEFCGPFELPE